MTDRAARPVRRDAPPQGRRAPGRRCATRFAPPTRSTVHAMSHTGKSGARDRPSRRLWDDGRMPSHVTPPRGMRDFLPADKRRRERVLSVVRDVYRAHGFDEIETPVVESSEYLFSGLGGDNEKQVFAVLRRGLDDEALRAAASAARARRPRPPLRPHGAPGPLLRLAPRRAADGLPQRPDRAGLAGREAAEGALPPVRPVRHRHPGRGRASWPRSS